MAPELDKIAENHNRKTIREEDAIEFFSILGSDVV